MLDFPKLGLVPLIYFVVDDYLAGLYPPAVNLDPYVLAGLKSI